MNKDEYRYTDTLFKRSQLVSTETGEGFVAKVRAVVADHARQLQGTLARAKREGGRFTQGAAGRKLTRLPGGVVVETAINQFGLTPTLMVKVSYPEFGQITENYLLMDTGWLGNIATVSGWQVAIWDDLIEYYGTGLVKLYAGFDENTGEFQGTPPNIDENNQYISYNNDRDNYTWPGFPPSAYSGLTRLLAQSLMGARRTDGIHSLEDLYQEIRNRMPVDFFPYSDLDPKRTFCIRAPNGDYWLLLMQDKRDADTKEWQGKAIGVRLFPSHHFRHLNDEIHAGYLRDEDAARADAFVLGYCILGLAPTDIDYVVFSDWTEPGFDEDTDDFAKLFSRTAGLYNNAETPESIARYASILPWSWGWVGKWQMRGKDDEKDPGAVCITGKDVETNTYWHYMAGVILRQTTISFTFDTNGRPSIVYEHGDWYSQIPCIGSFLAWYMLNKETIQGTDILPSSEDPVYEPYIEGQDLTAPWPLASWYNGDGLLSELCMRRYEAVESLGYSVDQPPKGENVIWTTTSSEIVELEGYMIRENGILLYDNSYVNSGTTYQRWIQCYLQPSGYLDCDSLSWWTNSYFIRDGQNLYLSSVPGVFWWSDVPTGPKTGFSYRTICESLNIDETVASDPPPDLLRGIWHTEYLSGRPDPDGTCSYVNYDWYLSTDSVNLLSTGKGLIDALPEEEDAMLSEMLSLIAATDPSVPVPDFFFYARAAYNSSGYLYGEHPAGLCTECIETRAGAWIGSA